MTGVAPVDILAEFTVTEAAAAASGLTLVCVRARERAAMKTAALQLFCFPWFGVDRRGVICIPCQNVWSFARVGLLLLLHFVEVGITQWLQWKEFFVFCFSSFCDSLMMMMMMTIKTMIIIPIIVKVYFRVHCTCSHTLANTQLPRLRALSILHIFILIFLYFIVPFAHSYCNIPLLYCTICTLLL